MVNSITYDTLSLTTYFSNDCLKITKEYEDLDFQLFGVHLRLVECPRHNSQGREVQSQSGSE